MENKWISVKDALPIIQTSKNGSVNSVLLWFEPNPECGSHYQIANTVWACKNAKHDGELVDNPMYILGDKKQPKKFRHKVWFTHWMYLPKPPKGKKGD